MKPRAIPRAALLALCLGFLPCASPALADEPAEATRVLMEVRRGAAVAPTGAHNHNPTTQGGKPCKPSP